MSFILQYVEKERLCYKQSILHLINKKGEIHRSAVKNREK